MMRYVCVLSVVKLYAHMHFTVSFLFLHFFFAKELHDHIYVKPLITMHLRSRLQSIEINMGT